MADWFIATEGVKVVKDSAGLWPQIITAVASIGAALGGVGLTHHFTRKREEKAAAAKQDSERLFIATELVFLLEQFADACCDVVCDTDPGKEQVSIELLPVLSYASVEGDWRSLPAKLLYRIRFLPALEQEARFKTKFVFHNCTPQEASECARYQYARVGLTALLTAYRLREVCTLPPPRKGEQRWTVGEILWRNRRELWRKQLIIQKWAKEGILCRITCIFCTLLTGQQTTISRLLIRGCW